VERLAGLDGEFTAELDTDGVIDRASIEHDRSHLESKAGKDHAPLAIGDHTLPVVDRVDPGEKS